MSVIVLPQTRAASGVPEPCSPEIPVPPYDKPLPPGYWESLAAKEKAPRPSRPQRLPLVFSVLGFVLVAGALGWVTGRSIHLNENGYVLPSMGEPNAEPYTLAPALQPPARVLRASLVSLPVRRAQLVELPLDASFLAHMPYGETVRCTYRGRVASQTDLPLSGNSIGDTYGVGAQQFVWVAPAGGIAQWIDP